MRKIGKIIIFVASIIVLIAAVGISANVLLDCLKTPAVYFANPKAIFNFSWTLLAIALLFLAGIYGITYAAKGTHRSFVAFIAWTLLVLGLISLAKAAIDCGRSNDWINLWDYIDNWVYNGVGVALYCAGYFLSVKK